MGFGFSSGSEEENEAWSNSYYQASLERENKELRKKFNKVRDDRAYLFVIERKDPQYDSCSSCVVISLSGEKEARQHAQNNVGEYDYDDDVWLSPAKSTCRQIARVSLSSSNKNVGVIHKDMNWG